MAERGSEHARAAKLIDPRHRIFLPIPFAHGSGKRLGVRPEFLDHVQLIFRRRPDFRERLHDRMVLSHGLDRIITLMIVAPAGHTEELSPIVDLSRAIGVHRAVNHNRRNSVKVRLRDAPNVIFVGRVGETLVVNDDIVLRCPVRIVV